jgi:tetratricopeptide (TPR) repeat protein
LTIISTGAVRTDSKYLEQTASPSSRRYGGDILLATPNWMGLFSFARAIYLTLNNLGMLHSQQQRMEEARKECKEALKINRELDQKNTQTCLPDVAMMLNNPGMLPSPQHRMEEARKGKEALKINRELDQKNTQTCLPDVAMMLNNLGMLHSPQHRMEGARKEYKEALKIDRELTQKNP